MARLPPMFQFFRPYSSHIANKPFLADRKACRTSEKLDLVALQGVFSLKCRPDRSASEGTISPTPVLGGLQQGLILNDELERLRRSNGSAASDVSAIWLTYER